MTCVYICVYVHTHDEYLSWTIVITIAEQFFHILYLGIIQYIKYVLHLSDACMYL